MPDHPESSNPLFQRLEIELEGTREFEEKLQQFETFLAVRGVNFQDPSPLPDLEGYVAERVGEAFIEVADENVQPETVQATVKSAVDDYYALHEKHIVARNDVSLNRLRLAELTAMKCLSGISESGQKDSASENTTASESLRSSVVRVLWMQGKWEVPWSTLVDQEFPGPDLTAEEIERFITEAPDQIERHRESLTRLAEKRGELEGQLTGAGYELQHADMMVVLQLASSILLKQMRFGGGQGQPVPRPEALEIIQAASESDHTAWRGLIDEYFPLSDNG